MPVTVIHQLFADLHDKICANLIQGFQGVGMHPCADVLLLQIRHGMGKACNDVRKTPNGKPAISTPTMLPSPSTAFRYRSIPVA